MVVVAEVRTGDADDLDGRRATAIHHRTLEVCGLPPRDVMLVKPGTLPKTSSGKLQRAKCRELYLDEELELLDVDRRAGAIRVVASRPPPRSTTRSTSSSRRGSSRRSSTSAGPRRSAPRSPPTTGSSSSSRTSGASAPIEAVHDPGLVRFLVDGVGGVPATRAVRPTTWWPTCSPAGAARGHGRSDARAGVGRRPARLVVLRDDDAAHRGHVRGGPLGGRHRADGGATRCSTGSRWRTGCAGRPGTTPRRRCTAATASSTTRRSPPTTSPSTTGDQGHRARRRLPPRQRHPGDLLRARRRAVRVAARRSGARLPVEHRLRRRDRHRARARAQPQRPAAGRHRRRRATSTRSTGRSTRSTRSARRCWSCRSASTRSSAIRSATSR